MRVCMILEGCYPYTRGGVSSWVNDYIKSSPDTEYVLWTIHSKHEDAEEMMYELPENVVELKKVFIEDAFEDKKSYSRSLKSGRENYKEVIESLETFLTGGDYIKALEICRNYNLSISDVAHSGELLDYSRTLSEKKDNLGLAETFYGMRSMLLPILYLIEQEIPEADIYHSIVAGYGGVLGSVAKLVKGKPFIVSEHGLYPREREEELLINDWLVDDLRDLWINFFYNLSECAYSFADKVTALFEEANKKQEALGCNIKKCEFIQNGIYCDKYTDIEFREDDGWVNIGAFIRFAPIKDVKTLIYAFKNLKEQMSNVRLYIFGDIDDQEYEQECKGIIEELNIDDIHILGYVDTIEYMKRIDLTVMTSISEGQPLALLESLAGGRPCVVTNVGNCKEIVEGKSENERGGICCSPMDINGITKALNTLCLDSNLRRQYGMNGKNRIVKNYNHNKMMKRYFEVYNEVL